MKPDLSKNKFGKWGEDRAVQYLIEKGYRILERNWKYERVELDIIAEIEDIIVFVEVKTRKNEDYGFPEEAVNYSKQENILMAAEEYIEVMDIEKEIRFDIISIVQSGEKEKIHHFIDAISPYDE